MSVSTTELVKGIRHLDLSDRPVCVHCSLRSFGHVDGGADAVVNAFTDEGATLIVPSFSWAFSAIPPDEDRPERNGTRYEFPDRPGVGEPYTTQSTVVDADMGALSAAVVAHPRRERGSHPLCSFAAVGPLAFELVSLQTPNAVWAPLESLVRFNGAVVLMGVDLTRLTLVHLAEVHAGRRPFVRWALDRARTVVPVDVGGCSDGFGNLAPVFAEAMVTHIGESRWTILPARDSLGQVTRMIEEFPRITQCDDPECDRCRDAIAGGPKA